MQHEIVKPHLAGHAGSAQCAPMSRDLTTSTGEPTQTATKPAPRPEARWQGMVSWNSPVASSACLICARRVCRALSLVKKEVLDYCAKSEAAFELERREQGPTES